MVVGVGQGGVKGTPCNNEGQWIRGEQWKYTHMTIHRIPDKHRCLSVSTMRRISQCTIVRTALFGLYKRIHCEEGFPKTCSSRLNAPSSVFNIELIASVIPVLSARHGMHARLGRPPVPHITLTLSLSGWLVQIPSSQDKMTWTTRTYTPFFSAIPHYAAPMFRTHGCIVACLRERFMADTIHTNIGSSALVALNPHKYVLTSTDSIMHKYAAEYRDTSEHREKLPPHIFQTANNAYYHMKRTTQDQCLIFSAETGSGKSENRRLAIKTLLELSISNPGKKGSKFATSPHPNLVAGPPSGERNFHIFYYLIAGASPEERQHLHLLDKTTYRYLGQHTAPRANGGCDDDTVRFDQLKVALKTIGLSKRHVAQTCQLIAAILHLGNLEFTIDRHCNEDATIVRNTDVLDIVSDFLGISPSTLESALSCKTKLVKKELCTVFLDLDGASDNRDDLAKTLYSLLFAWVNEHINQRLCRDDFTTFIGLFNLPGPQNLSSRPNSLDQFCINFANERLQNWMQKRLFESHVAEYNMEGISRFVSQAPFFDNSECIRLLQIMDKQARRALKKTDHTMVEAFQKCWGNHSSFKAGTVDRSGFPTFTVSHFNGPVTYSSESFLDRNLDALNPDFVSLLRGAADGLEGTGSNNPFMKGLFSAKAIATQAHPRNEDAIVAAQQAIKPMQAPSMRRKNTTKRMPTLKEGSGMPDIDERDRDDEEALGVVGSMGGTGGSPCVAGEFRVALDMLFETLDKTQSWYIFCLPNQPEGRSVKGQVRSVGLAEIACRNINVFEVGMTPDEFCKRYKESLDAIGVSEGSEQERVEQARTAFGVDEKDIVLGQSKALLASSCVRACEDVEQWFG
ncbi:P-loop containing nucleoside triphosphate hydrolase protein [Infundibulicybe gibba]|nr:P-loop containing nucleoside triphosphate hydrolase protein [Infundibulicybe gibba]